MAEYVEWKPLTDKPWGTEDDNSKIELRGIGCENVDFIQLGEDGLRWNAFVNTAVKLWVLSMKKFMDVLST